LSHSASPLICVEPEQIAFSILIFVRRDCDAGKIRAQCCKHQTVGAGTGWEDAAIRGIVTTKEEESFGDHASRQGPPHFRSAKISRMRMHMIVNRGTVAARNEGAART
jgi:hypothetical protein